MCLDVAAAGTANGTLVNLYTCNGTVAQVWVPQSNGEPLNPNSGKCLDDTGFGGSGTQVQIWACADSSNQQWALPSGTPTGAPFGGSAAAVPGTVYAANYDTGGQGVAYNATSTNGTANSYRSDGIDLEATSDTQNNTGAGADDLGWTTTGQWFKYTVNVATAGTYTVSLRLASPNGGPTRCTSPTPPAPPLRRGRRAGDRRVADLGDGDDQRDAAGLASRP